MKQTSSKRHKRLIESELKHMLASFVCDPPDTELQRGIMFATLYFSNVLGLNVMDGEQLLIGPHIRPPSRSLH